MFKRVHLDQERLPAAGSHSTAVGGIRAASDAQASHERPDLAFYPISSLQFSNVFFTKAMHWSATAPSIRRWSYPSVRWTTERMAMESLPSLSVTTRGCLVIPPTPMMAEFG